MGLANQIGDAQTAASKLYSDRADSYTCFIRSVGYPRGLRAVFMNSPVLCPDLRVLDAGCGTGVTTLALRSALEARGMPPHNIDAFDLTPAMLSRFRAILAASGIEDVKLAQANVLQLENLPEGWIDYDLVVTASMLEYIPRAKLPEALRALRGRLREGGTLLLFITRNNALMRPLIGHWWASDLYTRAELPVALKDAGFIEPSFGHFPLLYRHLDVWGHVVSARA